MMLNITTTDITSFFQTYSKGVFLTITLGLLSTSLFAKKSNAISSSPNNNSNGQGRSISTMTPPNIVQPSKVFTKDELDTLTTCYNEEKPRGKLLQESHGVTHYQVTGTENGPSAKGLVVTCHGIGTSSYAFSEFAQELVNAGYSVLCYDYYGHGYSKYDGDMFVEYHKDLFVDQLEDLLGFVEKETGETCVALVGHSTGGLAISAANKRWGKDGKRAVIPKLVLASPVFYAKKPFMARMADRYPGVLTSIMRCIPASRVIIGDAYIEAGEIAFAHDPITKKTVYAEQEDKKKQHDNVLFGKAEGKKAHPYLVGGILGINCNMIRGDLLEGHRDIFQDVLRKDGEEKSKALWIWGRLDKTVPFEENVPEVKKWEETYDNFKLVEAEGIGHEMFYENSKKIANLVIDFLDA